MTGLDPAIATLLASRFELLLSAIRPAAGATAGQTTMQAGTSRLFIDIQSGTAASAPNNAFAGAGPSAQTALSSVARTLDAISRFGGGGTPPLTGDAPLWPTAPRPASAFATLSGGLFDTAFASNPLAAAAQASAARALSQPAPPLPASALAVALAKTVGDSGLFYESHLVEWLAGQRPAASLADEPQARVDPDALALALDVPDQPAATDAWLDDPAAPRALRNVADPPDLQAPVHTVALPRNPQQAAALAESVRDAPVSVFSVTPPAAAAQRHPTCRRRPRCGRRCSRASIRRRFRSCASNSTCLPPTSSAGPAKLGRARAWSGKSRSRSAMRACRTAIPRPSGRGARA